MPQKTTSDFFEAFRCRECGKLITNDEDLPERFNEQLRNEELGIDEDPKDKVKNPYDADRPVIERPGRLEAHTSILEHSRDEHNGDFIGMYEAVELKDEDLEKLEVST